MESALQKFVALKNDDSIVPIEKAISRVGLTTPYPIGFEEFDAAMKGGVREGDLVIVTGISGQGKTTLAQNISVNLSSSLNPCLWFSYEVVVDNLYYKFKQMGEAEEEYLIYIPKRNTSGNIKWIKEKIEEGLAKFDTKFIFIDHIDFLSPTTVSSNEQRRIILRDICQELKDLCINLKVTIFLIAHVKKVQGREVEMQDIAESSGIYQLADYVFSVARMYRAEGKGKYKVEMISDESVMKMLKNRLTGELPIMKFRVENNLIKKCLI